PTQRFKRLLVLLVVGIIIVVVVVAGIVPFFVSGGGTADTREVPGNATRFDPVAAFPGVLDYAGKDAQLTSLKAYFVRSDGMMDLTANYNPRAEYEFIIKVPPPADAPPVGAGGTL